jgi:predicted phage terminase large subunit-like protein
VSLDVSDSFVDQLLDGIERLAKPLDKTRWATPGELHQAISPSVVQTPALDLVDRELVALVESPEFDRLALFMSPQEGKSERVSHAFALWLLVQNPELRIAIVSYSDEMARRHGAAIKSDAQTFDGTDGELDLGIRLREDSRAAGRWQIEGHAGGVYCVGIGGSLTGKPVDVLIIDDPLKDLEQAQSEAYRKRAMNFWRGVAVPRLGPGAKVVLVQTRWHESDMGGQLLTEEPDRWRKVSIPAIAEKPDDPLGREVGEPMISARGQRDWAGIRRSVGEYVWAALYQQRPAPAEGGLFKKAQIKHWTWCDSPSLGRKALLMNGREVYVETLWKFLTVDLAISKKTSADYTAVGVWGITLDGDLLLLDGLRSRIGEDEHFPNINQLRSKWDAGTVFVEAAQHGTTLVYEAGRAGMPIGKLEADADKFTRALPASARANAGRLWFPSVADAPWVQDWIDEHAAFPNATHDDTVDVTAYAARVAAAHWLPMETAAQEAAREARPDPDFIDFETANW